MLLIAVIAASLLTIPAASSSARVSRSVSYTHHPTRKHARRAHKRHHKRKAHKHKRKAHRAPAKDSANCTGANLAPTQENIETVRTATLCLVNAERARYGEPALINNVHLSEAATAHSYDMVARNYFEHVSPDGQTLLTRVRASKFIPSSRVGYSLGENIAWGTLWLATPRSIVKAWMASPGHRANILTRGYRYSGIGIDPAVPSSKAHGQAGAMYTQDFGTITSG